MSKSELPSESKWEPRLVHSKEQPLGRLTVLQLVASLAQQWEIPLEPQMGPDWE